MHVACAVGDRRLEVVRVIVDSHPECANMAATGDGATPLMRCCESGALMLSKYLYEHGGEPNAMDRDGRSVLHWALQVLYDDGTLLF